MISLLFWVGLAAAQPECGSLAPLDRDVLAVAWVSPAGRQVRRSTWLTVLPTAALRGWSSTSAPTVGTLLQHLGLRKRATTPKRPWKITILEVEASALCRPVPDLDEGTELAGLPVCERGDRTLRLKHEGCGYSTDLATQGRGADVFAVRWRDAASHGFCVLPLERFLQGR